MSAYIRKLSTLACRTLLAYISTLSSVMWDNLNDINNAAKNAVAECRAKKPRLFPVEYHGAAMALALSACYVKALKDSKLTVSSFLFGYAMEKWERYLEGDKGAFGDLFEILVRVSLVTSINMVQPSMLHVADAMKADVVSKKYGRLEIGHNGKTLSFGTLDDYMAGPYDAIAYGMFSDEDKENIIKLCATDEIEKAIDYVRNYTAIWRDKYAFQRDMDNLTRGAGITLKGADIQVVYNPSKYKAFNQAVENGDIVTMVDGVNE